MTHHVDVRGIGLHVVVVMDPRRLEQAVDVGAALHAGAWGMTHEKNVRASALRFFTRNLVSKVEMRGRGGVWRN